MTESVNCHAPYFRIFAGGIIFFDHRLHAVAHRFFSRKLAGYGSKSRGFSASPRCFSSSSRCQADTLCAAARRLTLLNPSLFAFFGWMFGGADCSLRNDCD